MNKKTEKETVDKKKKPEKILKYFDVKVEVMLPATLTYKILATDAEEAAVLIKSQLPTGIKHRLAGRRELKITVYDIGSTIIRFIKNIGR